MSHISDDELVKLLEREYFAACAGTPDFSEEVTLREFLHERGFSYKWLTQHGYVDEQYDQVKK